MPFSEIIQLFYKKTCASKKRELIKSFISKVMKSPKKRKNYYVN